MSFSLRCGSMRTALNPIVSAMPSTSFSQASVEQGRSTFRGSRRQMRTLIARGRGAALRELEELRSDPTEDVPTVKKLEWERPLQIIRYPDPRLRAQNSKIGVFDSSLEQLAKELLKTMYEGDDGVGLAAPQVGVNLRLMVYNPTGKPGDQEYILVNPKIVSSNKQREVVEEGCLSFPKIFANVERPTTVKIKAQDVKGAKLSFTLTGWQARIFQHEYDHLQGVLFHDRMKPGVLEKIKPQLVDLEDRFRSQHPQTAIQTVG